MFGLPITRNRALAAVLLLVGAVVLGARLLVHSGPPRQTERLVGPRPAARAARAAAALGPRLVVDVAGAVRRPGLYRLPRGARVDDALTLAGGATPKADLDQVNL